MMTSQQLKEEIDSRKVFLKKLNDWQSEIGTQKKQLSRQYAIAIKQEADERRKARKEEAQKAFDTLSGKKMIDVFFERIEQFIKEYKQERNNGKQ